MTAAALGSSFMFGERREAGYLPSFALAFAIHAVLLAILFLGVRVQSHAPQSISVELWEPPPPPTRVVEPPKPQPKAEPEPPKPEPKIEKPDIVEKPAPKKPEPKKPEAKKPEAKKPEAKKPPLPDTKAREAEFQRQMREQLAREQAAAQDRQMRDAAVREQAAARNRGLATWVSRIQIKIRGNINLPQEMVGNPEAVYDVALLPNGEVLTVRMRKSSGNKGYDEAVERAILKSSPLPKPEPADLFQRQLELRFRPQDK